MNVPVKLIPPIEIVTANPGQAVFDIPFTFFLSSEIVCWIDGEQAVGFSVAGMGDDDGGSLTLASPCVGGERVTMLRVTTQKRETEIGVGGDLKADAINEELSRLAMQIQDVNAKFARVLQVAVTDPEIGGNVPPLADRLNALLGFDDAGKPACFLRVDDAGLLAVPIPIDKGGTGAVTAALARASLVVPGLATVNSYTGMQKWAKGVDVAPAAGVLTLGDDGNYFDVAAGDFASIAAKGIGAPVRLHFDGVSVLTHSANLVLPDAANYTTAAGDEALAIEYAAGVWILLIFPAHGRAVVDGSNVQEFTSSGLWTKPKGFRPDALVMIEVWGAGGGGARRSSGNGSGGGAGGYERIFKKLSELGATESVTIGAGGAVQSTDSANGNNGGNTSFGALATMYGGRGGRQAAAGNAVLGGGHGGLYDIWALGANNEAIPPGSFSNLPGFTNVGATPYGRAQTGASGAAADNSVQSGASRAVFGNGGGAGHSTTGPASGVGTTGILGAGTGGNGNGAGAGGNGTAPGGGGGSGTTQGGSGADGKIRVTVF